MLLTNHLFNYKLPHSLSEFICWLCLAVEQFFSVLLTLFSFRPQGETIMQNWAYLAFELMQNVFLFLQTTDKKFWSYWLQFQSI